MRIIEVKPYEKIDGESFPEDTKLVILKENFDNQDFIDGRIIFSISDCDFKKLVIENSEDIDFNISIAFSGCYIERIEIETIVSKEIDLHLFTSLFSGNIRENNLRTLSVNNCLINGILFAKNLNAVNISFTDENVFPRIWNRLISRLRIENFDEFIKQSQSYNLENIAKINFYTHNETKDKQGLKIDRQDRIDDYKVKYFFSEQEKQKFSINLSIKYAVNFQDEFSKINSPYLYSLFLSGTPKGPITIENAKIQRLYLHNITPNSELTFYNIRPLLTLKKLAKIEIHKSNLKNTWFDNFDFSQYSTISFFRTRFSETSFTSCNFPKDSISFENFKSLENVHYPENLKESFYKDQYETFLQLKNALEKTGNIYEAQKLQAISFEALRKVKDISNWDKFILSLNDFSNGHGLSIYKPLKWFFVFSIVLYIVYLYSLQRIFNSQDIDFNLIGYYFSFIDLTHRSDFLVNKDEFNILSLSIDFINKVIIGYFIYQFIASFRKYGKGK
jgi:hypothetical protein